MAAKLTAEQIEEIKRLTKEGYTQSEIARRVGGVSKATIAYHQKAAKLKASNKWTFGEQASMEPVSVVEKAVEKPKKPEKKWTTVVDQTLQLTGDTGFGYTIGMKSDIVRIEPTYGPAVEIEVKDLISFGNELIEIAEKLNNMINSAKN